MRILFALTAVCLLAGCERVSFAKRDGLSLSEQARAIAVLHSNANALNAGDIEAMERTIHPGSSESSDDAQALIERYSPTVGIRGVRVRSQSQSEIVVEYEQTVEVKRGSMPFSSAILQTRLVRDGSRWGIYSTRLIRAIR